jgi:hypothetical protein
VGTIGRSTSPGAEAIAVTHFVVRLGRRGLLAVIGVIAWPAAQFGME